MTKEEPKIAIEIRQSIEGYWEWRVYYPSGDCPTYMNIYGDLRREGFVGDDVWDRSRPGLLGKAYSKRRAIKKAAKAAQTLYKVMTHDDKRIRIPFSG